MSDMEQLERVSNDSPIRFLSTTRLTEMKVLIEVGGELYKVSLADIIEKAEL